MQQCNNIILYIYRITRLKSYTVETKPLLLKIGYNCVTSTVG